MALVFDRSRTLLEGQNIRPPLGSFFNGQSYRMKVHPEVGRSDRSVLLVKMILQFQFRSGSGGSWTQAEKNAFAHSFVDSVVAVWNEKFRITTTSDIPVTALRDVGVAFEFPYYIDGTHLDDDFELAVEKIPSGEFSTSCVNYRVGNSSLDSEDVVAVNKGGSMKQRGSVHEFGHMLGLRDEYPSAKENMNHTGDKDSVMHSGEIVRERHYAPFAGWLTEKMAVAARLTRSQIDYKVNGNTNMANAAL
jgi:hypothetical protein